MASMRRLWCDNIDTKNLTILDFVLGGAIFFVCAVLLTLVVDPVYKFLVREVYSSEPGYLSQKQRDRIIVLTLPACALGFWACELFLREQHPVAFCVATFFIGFWFLFYIFMIIGRSLGVV